MSVIARSLSGILRPNCECITNADLDGVLSGMLLQQYLGWRIVGFSSCAGKPSDELWIEPGYELNENTIFIDLPVCKSGFQVIDQHFMAITKQDLKEMKADAKRSNPNTIRDRYWSSGEFMNGYTAKYPFGTVHFLLAGLESTGRMDRGWGPIERIGSALPEGGLDDINPIDLILRADRVVGNFSRYRPNCDDWRAWLIENGGELTRKLFQYIDRDFNARLKNEAGVGLRLRGLGCARDDGECVNLLDNQNREQLTRYLSWLGGLVELPALQVSNTFDRYRRLSGKRFALYRNNAEQVSQELRNNRDLFSYAIVTNKEVSITEFKVR